MADEDKIKNDFEDIEYPENRYAPPHTRDHHMHLKPSKLMQNLAGNNGMGDVLTLMGNLKQ